MTLTKRLTVFVLTVLLALQGVLLICTGTSFASENDAELKNQTDFLHAIGILETNFEETNMSSFVTRADFASVVAAIYGVCDASDNIVPSFEDISELSSAQINAINYLSDMKIVSGTSQSSFSPYDNITGVQALKIMVCLLGYEYRALQSGGYPYGFLSVAGTLGITKEISDSQNDCLSYKSLVKIIYNSLFADIFQQITYGDSAQYGIISGETLLSNVMHIDILEDVLVNANGITNLNSSEGAGKGYVELNAVKYADPDGKADDFVGRKINAYIKNGGTSEYVIYAELFNGGKDIVIPYENIESVSSGEITYYDEAASKRKICRIDSATNMLINHQLYAYNPEYIDLSLNGVLRISVDNSSSKYNFVAAEQYTNIIVDSIDYNGSVIYDRINPVNALDLSDYIDSERCEIVAPKGRDDITLIEKNDVVSVYATPDNSYIRIVTQKDEYVSGILEEISENSITLNKVSYEMASSYAADLSIYLGKEITAYLTPDGKVFYIDDLSAKHKYAYLVLVGETNGLDSTLMARIISESGIAEDLEFAEKVIVNGEKYTHAQVKSSLVSNGVTNQQLIQYSQSGDKKINLINTTDSDVGHYSSKYGIEDFYCSVPKTQLRYRSTGASFEARFSINSSTKIFMVPPDGYTEDIDKFSVISMSQISSGDFHTVTAYCMNDGGIAGAMILWRNAASATISGNSTMILVDSISTVIDGDGDSVQKIRGLANGTYVEYLTDGIVSLTVDGRTIKRGDIIRVASDRNGRISNVRVDINSDTYKAEGSSFGTFWEGQYSALSGAVYSMENGYVLISNQLSENLSDIFDSVDYGMLYTVPVTGSIMIYDSKLDKIYLGTVNDILSYKIAGEDASRLYIKLGYDSVKSIFVMK